MRCVEKSWLYYREELDDFMKELNELDHDLRIYGSWNSPS